MTINVTIFITNNYKTENNMKIENCTINGQIIESGGNGTIFVGDSLAREYMRNCNIRKTTDHIVAIKTVLETLSQMKAANGAPLMEYSTQMEAVRCAVNEVLGTRLSKKDFAVTVSQMQIEGLPAADFYKAMLDVDDKYASTPIDEWACNAKLTGQKMFHRQLIVAIAVKEELKKFIANTDPNTEIL